MTDYRTQPINQKMRILWNKWLTVLKKCNWKAAAYGKMRNAVFPQQSGRCQSDYFGVYYYIYHRSTLVLPIYL